MDVAIVGELVEHADGRIDLLGWTFDCDCCVTVHQAAQVHRQELIKLAKEAGAYSYKEEEK